MTITFREPKFKEVTRRVWEVGGKKVVTEAEFLGKKPVVLG
jgi:predicted metallo-beta-lactamase superfamily hydrolase